MRIKTLLVMLTLIFAASGCSPKAEYDLLKEIENNLELSELASTCPSEIVQETDISFQNETNFYSANQKLCLQSCLNGNSNNCFGLANHFNLEGQPEKYSRPLYSKSCSLGLTSACTNVGASMKQYYGLDSAECYTETFKRTCELKDPWGCTMYAVSLIYGEGVEKNTDAALKVMEGSCRFGETDRACSTALELIEQVKAGQFSEN